MWVDFGKSVDKPVGTGDWPYTSIVGLPHVPGDSEPARGHWESLNHRQTDLKCGE